MNIYKTKIIFEQTNLIPYHSLMMTIITTLCNLMLFTSSCVQVGAAMTTAITGTSYQPYGNRIQYQTNSSFKYSNNEFGHSISVVSSSLSSSTTTTTVAIGAPTFDYEMDDSVVGEVLIYHRSNNNSNNNSASKEWERKGTSIYGTIDFGWFGHSVLLSKDAMTLFIGSSAYSFYDKYERRISVYKYNSNNMDWEQFGPDITFNLKKQPRELFSGTIAMSSDGSYIAYQLDNGTVPLIRVVTYAPTTNQWESVGTDIYAMYKVPPTSYLPSTFVMSDDGTTIAIGIRPYLYNVTYSEEYAFVRVVRFSEMTRTWEPMGSDIVGLVRHDDDGKPMAISGDGTILVIAVPKKNDNEWGYELENSGQGRVYKYNDSSRQWEQLGSDLNHIRERAVAISYNGDRIAFGRVEDLVNNSTWVESVVTVYQLESSSSSSPQWYEMDTIRAPVNFWTPKEYGLSMDMSADGSIIAIGNYEDTTRGNFVELYALEPPVNEPTTPVAVPIHTPTTTTKNPTKQPTTTTAPITIPTNAPVVTTKTKSPTKPVATLAPVVAPTINVPINNGTWEQIGVTLEGDVIIDPIQDNNNDDGNDCNCFSDRFGASISTSADGLTVAIGATLGGAYDNHPGLVQVYQYNISSNQWEQFGPDIETNPSDAYFGSTVVISADASTIAISSAKRVGVYQYKSSMNRWEQIGPDIYRHNNSTLWYGRSIDMSGDGSMIAVGLNDDEIEVKGLVRLFKFSESSNQWEQFGSDVGVEFDLKSVDREATVVDMSDDGTAIAVGSSRQLYETKFATTRVYKFDTALNQWEQRGAVINGYAETFTFGKSMDMSADGTIIVLPVGGVMRVYRFDHSSLQWVQAGADLEGVAGVALSSDGRTMALATSCPILPTPWLSRNCVSVYKFHAMSSQWSQIGLLRPISSSMEDQYGSAIDMSADGTIVAIGGPGEAYYANIVEIYRFEQIPSPPVAPAVPMKAPTPTPVMAPIIMPVKAATKEPTPIECDVGSRIVTFNFYDARTDTIVAALTNGTVIIDPPPVNRTNIEAVIPCNDIGAINNSTIVELQLYNHNANIMIHRRVEKYYKYFLFGNNLRNIYNGRIVPGMYNIRVIVNKTMTSPFTTFTIVQQ